MKLHSNIYGWEYVWEEFAREKGGAVINDGPEGSTAIVGLRIPLPEFDSAVYVMPTSSGTAIVASFSPSDDFAFHLFTENLIHRLEKVFGAKDIKLGDKKFDAHFVVHSNSMEQVQQVFQDATLREAILAERICELKIVTGGAGLDERWEIPLNHNVLICNRDVFLDKFEQINGSYEIVVQVLAQLNECGAIGNPAAQEDYAPPAVPHGAQAAASPTVPPRLHSPLLGR